MPVAPAQKSRLCEKNFLMYMCTHPGFVHSAHRHNCARKCSSQIDNPTPCHPFCCHHTGLCQPAPLVKNWGILLVQTSTACMPLLTATSAFGLGRRCWSSPQQCNLHRLHTLQSNRYKRVKLRTIYAVGRCLS